MPCQVAQHTFALHRSALPPLARPSLPSQSNPTSKSSICWQEGSVASNICNAPQGQPLHLKLELGHREPLQGKELEAYYAARAAHAVEEDDPEPQSLLTPRQGPWAPDVM